MSRNMRSSLFQEYQVNRRSVLKSALLAMAARRLPLPDWIGPALAEDKTWRHGLSLYGDLKYQPGFKQFEYVNAGAPKGGTARQIAIGTFDNFNTAVAGVKGSLATGVDLLYRSRRLTKFQANTAWWLRQ
jgi:microcin C transport system substrate-binding protein